MLYSLVAEEGPDFLAVAFDPPEKSFRFNLYPEYKANRQKMPDDLRFQVEEIKKMVHLMGLPHLEHADYEADDILGSVAERYAGKDLEVVLVTGDKDAYQLVDENVTIYANVKGVSEHVYYDRQGIIDKLGIAPEQVIDYMAMMGDSSDNIPGIRGIGEKTALKLVSKYGSLDNLYEHIDELKGKQKEMIVEDRETAYLSRDLVTIRRDVPVEVPLKEQDLSSMKATAVRDYFEELEMRGIVRDYFSGGEPDAAVMAEKKNYRIIRTEGDLKEMVSEVRAKGEVSVDTETTSLAAMEAELVGISFSTAPATGWYLPMISRGLFSEEYIDPGLSMEFVRPLLEDESVRKIGQNIKYDYIVLKGNGVDMKGIYFDTMIASYLLSPGDRRHNLDDLAMRLLNYKTTSFKELTGTGKSAIPVSEVPLEKLADYAIEDADITFRLYEIFKEDLEKEGLEKLFFDVEMKLMEVLAEMERTGVFIDVEHFQGLAVENDRHLQEVEEKIYHEAGQNFNINSTRELSVVLFDKLGLKPVKKTKTGFSTDSSVLEALKGHHAIIDYLITYRTHSKLKSTYIDTLPKLINPRTGRIHTSYNQTVVATGRLSSSDPNLQNIPIRDQFGKNIRRGFVAEKGHLLLAADYSQIELRLAAHLSGDENMLKAFKEGIDIHSMTGSSVFGVGLDEVTPQMRRQAKIINFATIYGVSPFGLSRQADIGVKEAGEFIRLYFETYPGFKAYTEETIEFARSHGYVQTLLGRRRMVPEINSDTIFRREGAERVAINTPIQGTSADLIKLAMISIARELKEKKLRTKMIIQVHDELVFEVPCNEKEEVESLVVELMENALELTVPVTVDVGWGNNWEEAH